MIRPRTTRVQSAHPNRWQESVVPKPLTTENLRMLEEHSSLPNVRRPMSAVTKTTWMSNETVRPANLSWVWLLTIANDIFRWKGAITDALRDSGENARDWKTPHEIMKILKASSIYVSLPELKGLLWEFGFPHSGGSCSFLDLLRWC